ncbi:MAG TPA: alkaline phosphatase family protein, partial [Nocardioidaceae bacterium]|nr:alkaline phosphatase family protein [Nocardioidaceae bacterium]
MTQRDRGRVLVPPYDERCLSRLVRDAGAATDGRSNSLGLPDARRYVLVLVDGLGYDLLADNADCAPYLSTLLDGTLTCGLPSTTVTSLTSLGTGLLPGEHGVIGYTCRIPGTTRTLNALKWSDDVDPLEWQPRPTVLETIAADGAAVTVVNNAEFEGTGLTLCSQRGVPYHGVSNVWERLEATVEASESAPRSLVYTYESTLDHVGHKHGCTSDRWRDSLRAVDADLKQLREAMPRDAALVVTADHGMVDLPREGRFDVEDERGLLDDVLVFAGEARFRQLSVRTGATEAVAQRWRDHCGDRAIVVTRDEAEQRGWFGPVDGRVRQRIGDVLVASVG